MPVISQYVEPTTVTVQVLVYVCLLCGRDERHTHSIIDPMSIVQAWVAGLGWRTLPSGDVVCDRCAAAHPELLEQTR